MQLYAQESIDAICNAITGTLDNVKATLAEFMSFREDMEKLAQMTKPAAAKGTEN